MRTKYKSLVRTISTEPQCSLVFAFTQIMSQPSVTNLPRRVTTLCGNLNSLVEMALLDELLTLEHKT
jgi:hypothetical protein